MVDEPEPGLHLSFRQADELSGRQSIQDELQLPATIDEVRGRIRLGVLGDRVVPVAAAGLVVDDDQSARLGGVDAIDVAGERDRPSGWQFDDKGRHSPATERGLDRDGPRPPLTAQVAVVGKHPDQHSLQSCELCGPQHLAAGQSALGQGSGVCLEELPCAGDVSCAPGRIGCDPRLLHRAEVAGNERFENAVEQRPLFAGVDGVLAAPVLEVSDSQNLAVEVLARARSPGLQGGRRQVRVDRGPEGLGQRAGAACPRVEVTTGARARSVQAACQARVGEGELVHAVVQGHGDVQLVRGSKGAGLA